MFKTISAKNKLTALCKVVGLCLMSACICLSAVFSTPRKVAYAAGSGVTQADSLTAGSKVYFGEYPQDTVIKVNNWADTTKAWTENGNQKQEKITVPTEVNSNSVNVHTEIKKRIENLLKEYYSTSHTVGDETTPVMTGYSWHDTTVGYFAPKEDYANDQISYDNTTGYYTLLQPVSIGDVGYSAGSKFYPYNRIVDNVNKYYKVDVNPNSPKNDYSNTGKTVYLDTSRTNEANYPQPGVHPNEATIKFSAYRDLSNLYMLSRNEKVYDSEVCDVNNVVALHGYDRFQSTNTDTSADESYSETGTGPDGIFLYEVKPIEWTVVDTNMTVQNAGSGNYKMLVSSKIIDSNAMNTRGWIINGNAASSYGKTFDNSVLKGWLNGYASVDVTCTNGSSTYADTFYQSNRTFVNFAFSNNMDDLQIFTHTSSSAAKVGLLSYNEANSNNIKEAYKTDFALANGEQDERNGKYRYLIDDSGFTISRLMNQSDEVTGWDSYSGVNEYSIFGVRPVICLDVSSFTNSSKVGDIDSGDILNVVEPLGLNGEVNFSTEYTTPNLLHIQNDGVVDGSIVVKQKGSESDENYGTMFTVETSNITVDGKSAVSGFIVAGVRVYNITYGSYAGAEYVDGNIEMTPSNYVKTFIPVSSYIGGKDSTSTNTITSLNGQFVMTFYLVFEGKAYLIPAEKITNPIIYATASVKDEALSASGRNPKKPVNVEVAKILAGNISSNASESDIIDYGHMSTLHFENKLTTNSTYDYNFVFKYPTIIQSSKTSGDFSFEVASNHETTFENVIFDGQNDERTHSLVRIVGSATFNNCVMKNANVTGNGGALNIYSTGTVIGTKLEISNCKAVSGGGIYCIGNFEVDELIMTNNFASNGAASIYAATTRTSDFKILNSLIVQGNVEQIKEGRTVYSSYAVYISGYKVNINNPVFKENHSNITTLYLDNCSLDGENATLAKTSSENVGIFEENIAHSNNGLVAGAMIVNASGMHEYKFSNIKFVSNDASEGGYGAVLVQGQYNGANGVSFENCEFKRNIGLYAGGLTFAPAGVGAKFSGNFKISDTNFYSNEARSTEEPDIAGALLIKTDDSSKSTFDLGKLIFTGNKSYHYGAASINLNAQSSVALEEITLGGDVNDGNKLDNVRNVSTGSGALFAIKGATTGSASTISINNFVAQSNIKDSENTLDTFANSGVLYLENLTSADGVLLSNSRFVNNDGVANGGALIIKDCSGIVLNCLFEDNKVNVSGMDNIAVGGGAVYLSSTSNDNNNEIEIRNSTFINNSVTASGTDLFAGGGAVLAKWITLKLTNIYAINNEVSGGNMIAKGGAICSYGNTPTAINYITKCQHSSPKLVISGGKFEGNNVTSSNTSQGGAIWGDCVQIVTGGAEAGYYDKDYQSETKITTANGVAIFEGNETKQGELAKGSGGAIYSSSCFEILNENNASTVAQFTNNKASSGGAVYACGVATIDGGDFASNVASTNLSGTIGFGGAIYFANSELTVKFSDYVKDIKDAQNSQGTAYNLPMHAQIVRASFAGNSANYGGAIYSSSALTVKIDNNRNFLGFAKFSMLSIVGASKGLVKFEKNTATDNTLVTGTSGTGGAIYATSPVTLSNITFSENKAKLVSAIYYDNSAKTFTQAAADYVTSDKLTIENADFESNVSSGSGVVAASNYVDVTIKNSNFKNNQNGGAILIFSSLGGSLGDGTLENCIFDGNKDTSDNYSSDVISVSGQEVAINNCTFTQNGDTSKTAYGTAILVGKNGLVHLNNTTANGIKDNTISHMNGFILVQKDGNLKVNGGTISYLENTNSDLGGGAFVVYGKASFDSITISNCTAQNGGAIYVAEGGDVAFAGTISKCNATQNGGGIYVESGATLLVSGKLKLDLTYSESVIQESTATNGGGVFSLGNTTITHASLLSNSATENGGGIYAKENSSLTIAKDAIISGNTLEKKEGQNNYFGAGIYATNCYLYMSEAEISNNKFAENITNGVGGGLYASGVCFEAKDMTFSGNNASSQGGAMFVSNGAVTLSYCTFTNNKARSGGAVYLQNCSSSFVSCDFSGNSATDNGRAIMIDNNTGSVLSGEVVLQNCSFKDLNDDQTSAAGGTAKVYAICKSLVVSSCDFVENVNKTHGGNISHLYAKANNVEILDSNFTRGLCAGTDSGVTISAENVWVERCTFLLNADGGLSFAANYGVIANSEFLSNKQNGGLKLNKLGEKSSVEIIDTNFTNYVTDGYTESNGNISTSSGSAIYVSSGVNLRLSGEINVTKNVVDTTNTTTSGAIYVAKDGKFVITRGSKVVISDNTVHSTTSNNTSNLVFTNWQDTTFLEGGLLDGSSIGIAVESGNVVAQSPTNIPLETSDINKLFSDDINKYFSYSADKKQLLVYSKTVEEGKKLEKIVTATGGDNNTYAMTLSDITLLYSGMPKDGYKIDKSYFEVTSSGNKVDIVSMSFSLKIDGEFQEAVADSITLTSKGSYTVGVAVTAVKVGENVVNIPSSFSPLSGLADEIVVDIVGEYLYIISAPQATMTAGNASSFKITQAGLVQRSSGQEVAGTWSLVSPETATSSGYYACKFTPKQTSLYENKDSVTGTMYVQVMYDKMYYMTVGAEAAIYADSEGTTKIIAENFTDAMELLNDNGTFVFMTPYIVNNNENIVLSKKINFVRQNNKTNFAMIEVPMGKKLVITCTSGQALFEGQNDETQYPIFIIDGSLTLGSNVIVRNFKCKSYAASAVHGIICNNGTLVLQGCKIYDNEVILKNSDDYEIGGVVYNGGTMNILGGEFYGNKATNGNGGFVYSCGKLTVSGGTIKNNKSGYGAGLYVANGGSVVLSSGEITHNNAQNNGGGVFVAEGGTLNLGGTQILSNIAGGLGAGLYKAEGGTVLLSGGEEILTSTIESVEALNSVEETRPITQNNNWFVIMCVIFMVIATAIFVFLLAKSKKPQTFDKN